MLEPNSRRLLLESLQPPSGHRLDWALGTTYTLDLLALLTAPVAFAFSDWQDREGRPTADPLALLKAVRQYASRVCLYCQAGKIHVPRTYQPLLANLEDSIVEADAPRGGSFHPKLWFLRFVSGARDVEGVLYRILCLSRNMTFDRSWDTLLTLEGELQDRTNAFSRNHPLGQFVDALPHMSVRKLSREWQRRIETLAWEIRRVAFEVPDPFEDLAFWPIGIADSERWPFPHRIDRLLVVSPFVDDGLLSDLREWQAPMLLLSRPESLARLQPATLETFEQIWTLDDTAEPEPGEAEEQVDPEEGSPDSSTEQESPAELPLVGLHAKVYVAEQGWNSSILTGSANATKAAFDRNVEFLVELIGKKSRCGIDAVLGQPDAAGKRVTCLRDLLQEYHAKDAEPVADTDVERFERLVDAIARNLAALAPVAKVTALPDSAHFSVALQPTKSRQPEFPPGHRLQARPISQSAGQIFDVDLQAGDWVAFPSVSLLGLTSFYVFQVESPDQALQRQFVLNIPLEGAPHNRQEAILRELLSDENRVLRFLLLLLMDTGARDLSQMFGTGLNGQEGPSFLPSLFGTTLFESLVRTLDRDPQRLDHVDKVIEDLRRTPEGRKLLPENLDAIWEPIWSVRQQQLQQAADGGRGSRNA